MPREAANILEQLGSDYMVSATEGQVEYLALIHALRATSDGMKRLGEQQDRQSKKLDTLLTLHHEMDKRLAVIEENSLTRRVEANERRIVALEVAENKRTGVVGFLQGLGKSWPAVVGFISLLVYVVLDKAKLL